MFLAVGFLAGRFPERILVQQRCEVETFGIAVVLLFSVVYFCCLCKIALPGTVGNC